MTGVRLPYYPVFLADLAQSLMRLSKPDGVCAWQLLWHEYHYSRGLPTYDEKVRRIAGMTGNKKWERVREELLSAGFTHDWRNPNWDKSIAKADAAHAARKKGGDEKARRQRGDTPLPGEPLDYEDSIPF